MKRRCVLARILDGGDQPAVGEEDVLAGRNCIGAYGWHSSVAMAISDPEAPYDIVHIGHLGETQYLSETMRGE